MEESIKNKGVKPTHSIDALDDKQLKELLTNVMNQNKQLIMQLQNEGLQNMFKRLDYLFRIVENSNKSFSDSFIEYCTNEIENMMTIQKEENGDAEQDK